MTEPFGPPAYVYVHNPDGTVSEIGISKLDLEISSGPDHGVDVEATMRYIREKYGDSIPGIDYAWNTLSPTQADIDRSDWWYDKPVFPHPQPDLIGGAPACGPHCDGPKSDDYHCDCGQCHAH
jgi:hypothetical protein